MTESGIALWVGPNSPVRDGVSRCRGLLHGRWRRRMFRRCIQASGLRFQCAHLTGCGIGTRMRGLGRTQGTDCIRTGRAAGLCCLVRARQGFAFRAQRRVESRLRRVQAVDGTRQRSRVMA
jgi:hypothetical protein